MKMNWQSEFDKGLLWKVIRKHLTPETIEFIKSFIKDVEDDATETGIAIGHTHAKSATDELLDALNLILPMAKGYAAQHNVGRNKEMIAEVEELIKDYENR